MLRSMRNFDDVSSQYGARFYGRPDYTTNARNHIPRAVFVGLLAEDESSTWAQTCFGPPQPLSMSVAKRFVRAALRVYLTGPYRARLLQVTWQGLTPRAMACAPVRFNRDVTADGW